MPEPEGEFEVLVRPGSRLLFYVDALAMEIGRARVMRT